MDLNNLKINYIDVAIYDDYFELFDNNNYNWYAIFEYNSDE